MTKSAFLTTATLAAAVAAAADAQVGRFEPVTTTMLENPSPDDWLDAG